MKLFSEDEIIIDLCDKCGLYKKTDINRIKPLGKGKTKTLLIDEYITDSDLKDTSYIFNEYFNPLGYSIENDFYRMYAVSCFPTKNSYGRKPTSKEQKFCKVFVGKEIKKLNPKHIFLMGDMALDFFLMGDFEKTSIDVLRGLQIYDQKYKTWILPLYGKHEVMMNNFDLNFDALFKRDLRNALNFIESPPEPPVSDVVIEKVMNYTDIINVISRATEAEKNVYFDYETTGLKPFHKGHKIVSMSLAFSSKKTYVFPIEYRYIFSRKEVDGIYKALRTLFTKGPGFEAHNIMFEDSWTQNIVGTKISKWKFDTQLAAHILDNRSGITGLKMQTYINFGVRPYDREIKPYMTAGDNEEFNRIEEFDLDKLLTYCGKDTAYGRKLSMIQKKKLKEQDQVRPYMFFHKSMPILMNMHQNGICVDEKYYEETNKELEKSIEEIKEKLLSSPEAKKFKKKFGRDLNIASSPDLGELFYNVLGLKERLTGKGNFSVDKSSLEKINIPFTKDLLELRKLVKAKDTYFAQFIREIHNGKIHPFLSLNIPVSYRSSGQKPNVQNIPTRDPYIKKLVRSGVKPSPGNQLLFFDFSGAEVKTAACTHKDPNMIKYILDPTTDMHRDTAMDIWMLPLEEMTKDIRFYAKNMWVFAQFYGSYWKDCGDNLWETCVVELKLKTANGILLKDHLKSKGIKNKTDFLTHCENVEKIFWGERFCGYAQWKKDINAEYRRKGYVESFLGFRFQGYMNRKQCSNYIIQGPSFHLLLWTLQELDKVKKKEKWKSKEIFQIHDEGIYDAVPEECESIARAAQYIVREKLPKTFPFIIVPFDIELSITPINGSWYDKADYVLED